MNTYFPVIWALILAFTAVFPCSADLLTLKDGDRFTGTLENIAGGMVTFRTRLAGKMYVSTGEVAAINTTQSVLVTIAGEQLLPGRLKTQDAQHFVVDPERGFQRAVDLQSISNITRVPASPETD
ncbi:MAG: hypothetical protein WD873_04790, partial [Candidatus Hydrogenedentales bacterium]